MWKFRKIVLASICWHLQTPVWILIQIPLWKNPLELFRAHVQRGRGSCLSIYFIRFQISEWRISLKDMIFPTPGRCRIYGPCSAPRSLEYGTQLLLVVIIWHLDAWLFWLVTLQSVEACGLQLHAVLLLPLVSEILKLPRLWLFRRILEFVVRCGVRPGRRLNTSWRWVRSLWLRRKHWY